MKPTLWITGVSGFTGRHLVNFLKQVPDRPLVVGLDLGERSPAGVDIYHCVDLTQWDDVASLACEDRPKWVIHLAGLMPPAKEPDMWLSNVGGTMSLLQGLATGASGDVRVVSVGSAAEYIPRSGETLKETSPCGGYSPYGRTKWAQTILALSLGKEMGLTIIVPRTFNLIGPGLSSRLVAGWLCEQFTHEEAVDEVVLGNTKSARDFVDVRDAVVAYWSLAQHGEPGEVYNVCTGVAHTIEHLIFLFQEVSGRSPKIRVDPARLRNSDPSDSCGDDSKLQQATGWQSKISLKESIAAMLYQRARLRDGFHDRST